MFRTIGSRFSGTAVSPHKNIQTALFVVIFLDQWKAYKSHIPAILGISTGVLLLIILGSDRFMLPTVVLVSGILILLRRRLEKNE